eukprot:jgi/Chlat1/1919/Chrsp152S00783
MGSYIPSGSGKGRTSHPSCLCFAFSCSGGGGGGGDGGGGGGIPPTCARSAPDGRVFVAEKAGKSKVFNSLEDVNPQTQPTTSTFTPSTRTHPDDSVHDSPCPSLNTPCKAFGCVSRWRIVGTKAALAFHPGGQQERWALLSNGHSSLSLRKALAAATVHRSATWDKAIAVRSMASMPAALAGLVVASHGARFGCQHPGQRFIHKAARPLQHAVAFPRHRRTAISFCANLSNGGRPDEGMRDPANASESSQSEEPPMSPLPVTPQTDMTIDIFDVEEVKGLQEYQLYFLDAANFNRWYAANGIRGLFKDGKGPGLSDLNLLEEGVVYHVRSPRGDLAGRVQRMEAEQRHLTARREAEFSQAVVRIFSQRLGAQVVPRPEMRGEVRIGDTVLATVTFVGTCGSDLIVGELQQYADNAKVVNELIQVARTYLIASRGNVNVHVAYMAESVSDKARDAVQSTCRQYDVIFLARTGEDIEPVF